MDWPVLYRRKLRYSDCDPQAIVFNGNYLTYYDDTLTDFFDAAGVFPEVMHDAGFDVLTVHAELDFEATAGMGDVLIVGARVARVGNTSLTFDLESWVESDERRTTKGQVVFVCVDRSTHDPVPVPELLIDALQRVHHEPLR